MRLFSFLCCTPVLSPDSHWRNCRAYGGDSAKRNVMSRMCLFPTKDAKNPSIRLCHSFSAVLPKVKTCKRGPEPSNWDMIGGHFVEVPRGASFGSGGEGGRLGMMGIEPPKLQVPKNTKQRRGKKSKYHLFFVPNVGKNGTYQTRRGNDG